MHPKPRKAEDCWESPEAGRGKAGSSLRLLWEQSPGETLISDLQPQNAERLAASVALRYWLMVTAYSNPGL